MNTPQRAVSYLFATGLLAVTMPAHAFLVLDIANLVQNTIQNDKLQTVINNQIRQIQQGDDNLAKLTLNNIDQLQANMVAIRNAAMQFKEGISHDQAFLGKYKTLFPDYTTASNGVSISEMNEKLNDWSSMLNQNTLDTLTLSAQVLASLPADQQSLNGILNSSQGAQGILQAVQAGNQALGLITQQLIKINTQLPLYNQADLFFKQTAQSEADMVRLMRERANSNKEAPAKPIDNSDKGGGGNNGNTNNKNSSDGNKNGGGTDKKSGGTDKKSDSADKKSDDTPGFGFTIGKDGQVDANVKMGGVSQTVSGGPNGASAGTTVNGIGQTVGVKKDGITATTTVGDTAVSGKVDASGGVSTDIKTGAVNVKNGSVSGSSKKTNADGSNADGSK